MQENLNLLKLYGEQVTVWRNKMDKRVQHEVSRAFVKRFLFHIVIYVFFVVVIGETGWFYCNSKIWYLDDMLYPVIHFLHEDAKDGDIRIDIVGTNEAGFTISFNKDAETVVDAEFKCQSMDKEGTLILYREEITPKSEAVQGGEN